LERSQDRDGFVDMGSLAEQIRMFAQTVADQDDGMFTSPVADHAGLKPCTVSNTALEQFSPRILNPAH
jgi:hypothetical protein